MQEIEDLIAALPADEKLIAKRLRALILDTDPRFQERISYGVPYFYHHRRICFIWPTSLIPCGYSKPVLEKITLGFCYGNLLSNAQGLLERGDRKQVCVIHFTSVSEINDQAVREIIQEAVPVDEEFKKNTKPNKKKR